MLTGAGTAVQAFFCPDGIGELIAPFIGADSRDVVERLAPCEAAATDRCRAE